VHVGQWWFGLRLWMDERLAFRGDGGVSIAAPVGSATAVDSAYVNRTHRGNCQRECSTVPRQSVCCTGPHELFCVGSIFCTLCCFYTRVHSQTNSCACMHAHTHAHTHTHTSPSICSHTHTARAHTCTRTRTHTPHQTRSDGACCHLLRSRSRRWRTCARRACTLWTSARSAATPSRSRPRCFIPSRRSLPTSLSSSYAIRSTCASEWVGAGRNQQCGAVPLWDGDLRKL